MMRMKKAFAKVLRGLIVVLSKFPLKFHYFMGDVLAWIIKNVIRYRRDVVWMNISRSFPDKRYKELRPVSDAFYRHMGEIFAEAIWFGGSSYARLNSQGIVKITNPQILADIYRKSPSVTLLCTHCGNWEIIGGLVGYMTADGLECPFTENDISVVYKKLSSEVADTFFALNRVAPLPGAFPECEIESMNILRYSIKNRDKKKLYIYPADQAPYAKTGKHYIGTFLNQHTYAMTGSVGVACKLSHAVVYMKMKSVKRGLYEIEFIPICSDASEHSPEDLIRIYYQHLEEEIRETPYNWLWTHKRWK